MAEVFIHRRSVGTLSRDEPTHRFTYGVGVPESLAVSLLMPVAAASYPAERPTVLHPVFDMNLPEGSLREALNQLFAKAASAGSTTDQLCGGPNGGARHASRHLFHLQPPGLRQGGSRLG